MATMTFLEMQDALRWELDQNQTLTAAQLKRWLNWAMIHVSQPNIHKHQSLQAEGAVVLVADQANYALTALGFRLWGIYSTTYIAGTSTALTNRRRRLRGAGDIRWLDGQFLMQGEPSSYAVWGGSASGQTLWVNSRPASSQAGNLLLVRGYRQPAQLVNDGDLTVLNDLWDEVVVMGAKWRGWRGLNRPERAEIARVEFGLQINEIQEATKLDASDWGGRFEFEFQEHMQVGG